MGIDVGPIEATDGLVVHLDAGNIRSYAGSGNTWYNLITKCYSCSFCSTYCN